MTELEEPRMPQQHDQPDGRSNEHCHCGGELKIDRRVPQPYWGKWVCSKCGKFSKWARTPFAPGPASRYIMPRGKYRGWTPAQIAAKDRPYLKWAVSDEGLSTSRVRDMIAYFLRIANSGVRKCQRNS
jgi:hypothetical protein